MLSPEERDSLLRRKFSLALSNDELDEINTKLSDDDKEQIRRKKMDKKQSKDIKDTKERRSLNKKFNFLNQVVDRVRVERNANSTRASQILIYDLFSKNAKGLLMGDFLEAVKPAELSILRQHNTSKRVQFKIHFVMNGYRLLTGELEETCA